MQQLVLVRYIHVPSVCVLAISLALTSAGVQAVPIDVTGDGAADFNDLGTSTVDLRTGLEWLDVTETTNRSFNDVFDDINDFGTSPVDQFRLADQWRVASKDDFRTLISNWFDFTYDGGFGYNVFPFGYTDNTLVEEFINTFGDTLDAALDSSISNLDIDSNSAGYTLGMLSTTDVASTYQSTAIVHDTELSDRFTGQLVADYLDYVFDGYNVDPSSSSLNKGTFIVRSVAVPEPGALGILIFGLCVVGVGLRNHRIINRVYR